MSCRDESSIARKNALGGLRLCPQTLVHYGMYFRSEVWKQDPWQTIFYPVMSNESLGPNSRHNKPFVFRPTLQLLAGIIC